MGNFSHNLIVFRGSLLGFGEVSRLVFLKTGVALADKTLDLGKFAGLFCATHGTRLFMYKLLHDPWGKFKISKKVPWVGYQDLIR